MVRLARISHCQLAHSGASVSIFGVVFPRRGRNRNADCGQGKEYGRSEYRCHVVGNAHTRWRNKAVSAVPLPGSEGGPHYTLLASVDSAKPSQYAAGEGNNENRDQGTPLPLLPPDKEATCMLQVMTNRALSTSACSFDQFRHDLTKRSCHSAEIL